MKKATKIAAIGIVTCGILSLCIYNTIAEQKVDRTMAWIEANIHEYPKPFTPEAESLLIARGFTLDQRYAIFQTEPQTTVSPWSVVTYQPTVYVETIDGQKYATWSSEMSVKWSLFGGL